MIPFSPPRIDEKNIEAVIEVLKSGWITTGPKVQKFEKLLSEYLNNGPVLCVNSATAGLELSLRWYGVGPGDEVIVPAITYAATANVVLHCGAKPIFVDISPEDFNIDIKKIEPLINNKTKAIIPVDIAGLPCHYTEILDLIDSSKKLFVPSNEKQEKLGRILLLSDAAHSLGAIYKNKKTGNWGDIIVFSFHAVKNLTTGEGGAIVLNLPDHFEKDNTYNELKINSLHGQTKDALSKNKIGNWEYDIVEAGYKYNMTDIQAAIGIVEILRYDNDMLKKRKKIFEKYSDASYDYLNRIKNNTNLIPTFQSLASVSPTASYVSDDFFALLDDGEGYDCYGALDVAVGRFPVNTENEAWAMVEKIERYYKKQGANTGITICDDAECLVPQLGDWRNRVVLIADDEDGNTYINQAENIANIIETKAPQLNIQKIYLDAYPQISTPAGQRAPEVNSAINDAMNNGMLLFNYIGHGGEEGLAHERIVQISDILSWHNACAMPLVVTATCEFSRFDDPERTSAGEYVILNPKGGAVTMMTTSRIAYSSYNAVLNNALIDTLMDFVNSDRPAFGDLFKIAKNSANNAVPLRNFVLLGDPAARITLPYNKIIIDTINNNSISAIDTLSAFEFVTIKGHIEDFQADVVNNFNGTIYVTMYDKKQTLSTLGTDISSFPTTFESFTNIVYKGSATVKNGEFKIDFFMPIDIQYDFDKGRLTLYAENGMEDASGYTHDFLIGGTAIPIADNEGPEINLFLNSINFRNGDIVDENPTILALISDEHGINLTGQAIGHDLVAWIDYDYKDPYILNPYFRYFLDSYKEGYLIFPLHDLSAGYHSLTLKAWDVFNNSSEATVTFQVIPKHNLTINTVIPYPNPMTTSTTFFIQHNQACCDNKIIIEIYDLLGKKIAKLYDESYNESYANTEIYWDGKSIHGNTVTPGTYVYKAWLENDNGTSALSSGKILILPEK
jgi:dTDP-4-amino-4,6-dideoxygalactose transaminase